MLTLSCEGAVEIDLHQFPALLKESGKLGHEVSQDLDARIRVGRKQLDLDGQADGLVDVHRWVRVQGHVEEEVHTSH